MKEKRNNYEETLCGKCHFADMEAGCCRCPELSPDIWDYVEPRIETRKEVQAALSVCTQQMLREHKAAPLIAPAITAISGKCDYYTPQAAEYPLI